MKVKLMLDKHEFQAKPTGFETGGIQKRIAQTEIEIEELANGLCHGYTCKPALLIGSKSADWIEQQVFMLDFDHGTTVGEQLITAEQLGITPVFLYTSFSHTEQEHRFRMVFINDSIITDVEKRNKLQSTLIHLFDKSDKVTFDCTRIFYGGCGHTPISPNYEARINADEIISKHYKPEYDISKPVKKAKIKEKSIDKENIKVASNDDYLANVQAIKELNVRRMREIVGTSLKGVPNKEDNLLSGTPNSGGRVVLRSLNELYDYINAIDLCAFLGVEEGYFINCILPNHDDDNPSAHIFTTKDGTQVYKCFGCGKALTIIALVEILAKTTRRRSIEFIKRVYNIELIESDWMREQREIMRENVYYLDTEEFKIEFPNLSKLIRTRKIHLKALITYFSQLISEELQVDNKPLFFSGYPKLLDVCGINQNKRVKLSQSLTLFHLLNLIEKIEPTKLPKDQLNKAKHISAKYGFKKLTNFYQFNEYGYLLLEESEEIAKELIAKNISIKGISREYIMRTFGTELADKVFPQYKFENHRGNGVTKKSDEMTMKISEALLEVITNQGYIRECDLKVSDKIETQWKKSIQEILDAYGLVRVRATKSNKEKYNIPEDIPYQSFVIVKAE